MKTTRLQSLDGWRAVSIILVVGSHLHFSKAFPAAYDRVESWFFDGNLGVRFFFVISGFLISYLLLQEHEQTRTVNLKNFYIRRALRILPVCYAFLLVVFLFQLFTSWKQPPAIWLANIFFLSDFIRGPQATGHLWSLAVEEQFYLIWPFLLIVAGCQNKKRLCLLLAIPLITAPICRWVTQAQVAPQALQPFFQFFSLFNYCDSLAIGCLAAVFFGQKKNIGEPWKFQRVVLAGALIVVPQIFYSLGTCPILLYMLGPLCQAIGFALLLLQSIWAPSRFKLLNGAVMIHLGVLSYSIYIWQQICWSREMTITSTRYWYLSLSISLVMIYLVSAASYYGLEKPLMGLRARFRIASNNPYSPAGRTEPSLSTSRVE
jgi:peptidoglycan/LPS O-acetylase OafA/YrhL